MRSAFALFVVASSCLATVASGDVIMAISPSIITLNEPTEVVIALTATDAFAVVVERIALDFDGSAVGGTPTDVALTVSEFRWLGGLGDPKGKCASPDLPDPHTACGNFLIPWGSQTPIATMTVTGVKTGVFNLAPNAEFVGALGSSPVVVEAGDPAPITVVPEPTTFMILVVFGGMIVLGRSRSYRRGARLAMKLVARS